VKQHLLHIWYGIDQTIIDNAIGTDTFMHVCGQKADTLSNYCDNIQPYDKRHFSFCQMWNDFL